MAPMTGAIPNGKENGLVFLLRLIKSLIPPRIPINRIMGMLQKVWAFFVNQPVCMFLGLLGHNLNSGEEVSVFIFLYYFFTNHYPHLKIRWFR